MSDEHQRGEDGDRRCENDPFARGDGLRVEAEGVSGVGSRDQADGGDVENHVEPQIPGDDEANGVSKSVPRPFIETAFDGHALVEMRDDEGLRDEEERNGDQPEDDVRRASEDGGTEEIGDDDEEDRGENEVSEAEFLREREGWSAKSGGRG